MNEMKQILSSSNEPVLLNVERIAQNIKQEDLENLTDVIRKEIGDRKLSKDEIEQLQEIMNVDALEGAKWRNVADVLKYISVFAIAERNPEALR